MCADHTFVFIFAIVVCLISGSRIIAVRTNQCRLRAPNTVGFGPIALEHHPAGS
jgi:hypothetical protein